MCHCNTPPCDNKPGGTPADPLFRQVPYAMAYVRIQECEKIFPAQEALKRGTAFPSLVKPFTGTEVTQ